MTLVWGANTLPPSCTVPDIPSCFADAPKGVEILLSSSGKNILPGDLVTLTCQVNSSYPAVSSVQWVKDGMSLEANGRVLQLSSATWNDSGVYTCEAMNPVGSLVSPPVSLHVFSKSWMRIYWRAEGTWGHDTTRGLHTHANTFSQGASQEGPGKWDKETRGDSRRLLLYGVGVGLCITCRDRS